MNLKEYKADLIQQVNQLTAADLPKSFKGKVWLNEALAFYDTVFQTIGYEGLSPMVQAVTSQMREADETRLFHLSQVVDLLANANDLVTERS